MTTTSLPAKQRAVQLVGPDQLRDQRIQARLPSRARIRCSAGSRLCGLCFSDLKLLKQFSGHARKSAVTAGVEPQALLEMPHYVPGDKPTVSRPRNCRAHRQGRPQRDALQRWRPVPRPDRLSLAADCQFELRLWLQFRRRPSGIRAAGRARHHRARRRIHADSRARGFVGLRARALRTVGVRRGRLCRKAAPDVQERRPDDRRRRTEIDSALDNLFARYARPPTLHGKRRQKFPD